MLRLNLPFDYHVEAYVNTGNNRAYVVVSRNHAYHPFVCYSLGLQDDNGFECNHGHYVATRSQAFEALFERSSMAELFELKG